VVYNVPGIGWLHTVIGNIVRHEADYGSVLAETVAACCFYSAFQADFYAQLAACLHCGCGLFQGF
jgi:hypothetical protein